MTHRDEWLERLAAMSPADPATLPSEFFTLSRDELLADRPASRCGPAPADGDPLEGAARS